MGGTGFGPAAPIFRVANLRASLEYYLTVLGFRKDWGDEHVIAAVSRDRCNIFLAEGDQGQGGAWTWISAPHVDALHDDFASRGARIRQGPTNFPWALEIQVEDLDGNVMRFGCEPKPDIPFGPWLDMHGQLWAYHDDGSWTRVARG